jgi:hypothetical protein
MKRYTVLIGFVLVLCLVLAGGTAGQVFAPSLSEIERFDVKKGTVSDRVPSTPEIQEEAGKLIQSLGAAHGIFRADPKDGTVLRIPIQPSQEIRKPGFYAFATEMYLFLPGGEEPYILIFSEENEPRLFAVKHPVDRLLKLCGWEDARGR